MVAYRIGECLVFFHQSHFSGERATAVEPRRKRAVTIARRCNSNKNQRSVGLRLAIVTARFRLGSTAVALSPEK